MKTTRAPVFLRLLKPACLVLILLAACQSPLSSTTPSLTLPPTTSSPGTPTLAMFTNPILDSDFPDPDVLKVGDTYYAYATNTDGINIQVARSKDLVHWEMLPDALPKLPSWAVQSFGWAWAPEVFLSVTGGPYMMYFVARFAIGQGGTQCIGLATSEEPAGPFDSPDSKPFICQTGEGGSIDPSTFLDEDGQLYVLWKNDGNSGGGQTWLYIQKVSSDGQNLQGEPTRLLTADQAWEGILVEAPTLWKQDGKYYLFYSANMYNTPRYATGYAEAESILGPYLKPNASLLATNIGAGIVGPGGQDILIGPRGKTWMLFHGWAPEGYRRLYLAPLDWQDGAPVVRLEGKEPIPMP